MGITLTKKVTVVDVNGKRKAEPKRRYTNSDLPFPPDSFSIDLAHYQKTFIPDLIDWAGSLERPFAASTRPEFKPTVQHIWDKYFSAYPFTDAVEYMVRGLSLVRHLLPFSSGRRRYRQLAKRRWKAYSRHDNKVYQ